MQLKAHDINYVMWSGVAVTVYVVERTPALMRLHEEVIKAVEPFSVSGGTGAAFVRAIGFAMDEQAATHPRAVPAFQLGTDPAAHSL